MNVSIARFRGRLVAPALLTVFMCVLVAARLPASDLIDPSKISFDHDGKDVTGFAVYVTADGSSPIRIDLGQIRPDGKGRVVAPMPVLPPGSYSIEIAAYNAAGESPRVFATPARFRVTKPIVPSHQADTPGRNQAKDEPARNEPAKSKRGFLGKVYGAVVGSDAEEGK